MKFLLITLAVLLSVPAFAKTSILTGAKAQKMMESLAGAGFEVKNVDKEWGTLKEPISISTGSFYCHYDSQFPDGWMVNARCQKGAIDGSGDALINPLALAQAVKDYGVEDAGLGNRWLSVDDAKCTLNYNAHAYRCVISAKE